MEGFPCSVALVNSQKLLKIENVQDCFVSDHCLNVPVFQRSKSAFCCKVFSSASSKLTKKGKTSYRDSPELKAVIIQGMACEYYPKEVLAAHLKSSCVICHPSSFRTHLLLFMFYLN